MKPTTLMTTFSLTSMGAQCTCIGAHDLLVGSKVTAAGRYPLGMCTAFLNTMLAHYKHNSFEVNPVSAGPVLFKSEPCPVCNADFQHRDSLWSHITRAHKDVAEPYRKRSRDAPHPPGEKRTRTTERTVPKASLESANEGRARQESIVLAIVIAIEGSVSVSPSYETTPQFASTDTTLPMPTVSSEAGPSPPVNGTAGVQPTEATIGNTTVKQTRTKPQMKDALHRSLGIKRQLRSRVIPNVVPVQRGGSSSSAGPYIPTSHDVSMTPTTRCATKSYDAANKPTSSHSTTN